MNENSSTGGPDWAGGARVRACGCLTNLHETNLTERTKGSKCHP